MNIKIIVQNGSKPLAEVLEHAGYFHSAAKVTPSPGKNVNTGCNSYKPPALKLCEFVFNLRNL